MKQATAIAPTAVLLTVLLLASGGCEHESTFSPARSVEFHVVNLDETPVARIGIPEELLQGETATVHLAVGRAGGPPIMLEGIKGNCGCQSFSVNGHPVDLPAVLTRSGGLPVCMKINTATKAGLSTFGVKFHGRVEDQPFIKRLLVTANVVVPITFVPTLAEVRWRSDGPPDPIVADLVFGSGQWRCLREVAASDPRICCSISSGPNGQCLTIDTSAYWNEVLRKTEHSGLHHETVRAWVNHPDQGVAPGRLDLRFRRSDRAWTVTPERTVLAKSPSPAVRRTVILESCQPFSASLIRIECSLPGIESEVRQLGQQRAVISLTAAAQASPGATGRLSIVLDGIEVASALVEISDPAS